MPRRDNDGDSRNRPRPRGRHRERKRERGQEEDPDLDLEPDRDEPRRRPRGTDNGISVPRRKPRLPRRRKLAWWRTLAFPATAPAAAPQWDNLWHWLALGLALRIAVALAGDFVLHPDEVMQYMEPAHAQVFGNGIIYWEFFYGGRSWLLPGFVVGLLWICKAIGLDQPWFYTDFVKVVFCLVSMLLPLGVYRFARHMLDERTARVALVLTCLMPYLVGYAHKPFTEFIATYMLFGILGVMVGPRGHDRSRAMFIGFVLTFAALIRMQYAPAMVLVWLAYLLAAPRRTHLPLFAGSVGAVIFVGMVEYVTWGNPINSYQVNLLINLLVDQTKSREPVSPEFYFLRLIYMTAGLVLPAIWVMLRDWRRHFLLLLLAALVLVIHVSQPHKEMRFVFILLPLFLVGLADWIAAWWEERQQAPRHGLQGVAAGCLFHCVLVLFNLVPLNGWLHHGNFYGEVFFLRQQGESWKVINDFRDDDEVKGILFASDPVYLTPGYYYLHREIPFYFDAAFNDTVTRYQVHDWGDLVTHIVVPKDYPVNYPGFEFVKEEGRYAVLKRTRDGPVASWRVYQPHVVQYEMAWYFETQLHFPHKVPLIDLVDYPLR